MSLFTEIDLSDKSPEYIKAVEDYIERSKQSNAYFVEYGNPRFDQRFYPTDEAWYHRLSIIDSNRVCAKLIDPIICDVRKKFIAEIEFCGPFGQILDDMYYVDSVTFALAARKFEAVMGPDKRVTTITQFDVIPWANHEDNPDNKTAV
jgi:hypothetical protein